MTTNPIDDYVHQVASHLKLRGKARRQALADLLELLTEQAQATSEEAAIAEAGPPASYAAELDAQFGTTHGAFQTILGMPNSFTAGIGRRMAGTFDPADPRLLVPKVIGAGWDINMGAVAVHLGLLNPDDLDDEILDEAREQLLLSQAAAGIVVTLGIGATVLLFTRREDAARLSGRSQTANLLFGALTPVLSAALLLSSSDERLPPAQRLTMPGLAAFLGLVSAGSSLQYALRPRGQSIVVLTSLAGFAAEFGLSYLPVRAALNRNRTARRA